MAAAVAPSGGGSIAAFDIDNTLNEKLPAGGYALHWQVFRTLAQLQQRGYTLALVTGRSLDYAQQLVRSAPDDVRELLNNAFVSAENGAAFALIDAAGRRLKRVRLDESLVVPQGLRSLIAKEIAALQSNRSLAADIVLDENGPRGVASVGTPAERNLTDEEKRALQTLLQQCVSRFESDVGAGEVGANEVQAYPSALDVRRRERKDDASGVTLKERGTVRLLEEFQREHGCAPERFIAVGDTVTAWGVAGSSDMQTALAARKCGLARVGFGFVGPRATLPLARRWSQRAGIALFVPPRLLDEAQYPENGIVGPKGVLDLIQNVAAFEVEIDRLGQRTMEGRTVAIQKSTPIHSSPSSESAADGDGEASPLSFPTTFVPIVLPVTKSVLQLGLQVRQKGGWETAADRDEE